jgi:hypothetical protein
MNVFTTDHPLTTGPSPSLLRLQRRLLRGFLVVLVGYPLCLLLIGPYSALNGTGWLEFLPQVVRDAPFYSAVPVYCIPGLRSKYDDYLHWWYRDPNEADPPTGWH